MEKDEIIEGNLIVEGNIFGKDGEKYNLIIRGDLNCYDLDCRNLNCLNLNCLNLNCLNLNCSNLDCWNLDCLDLNCLDLNFWAVAFAYKNIKAKSIKSYRDNSRCFVLGGSIILNGKDIGKEYKEKKQK